MVALDANTKASKIVSAGHEWLHQILWQSISPKKKKKNANLMVAREKQPSKSLRVILWGPQRMIFLVWIIVDEIHIAISGVMPCHTRANKNLRTGSRSILSRVGWIDHMERTCSWPVIWCETASIHQASQNVYYHSCVCAKDTNNIGLCSSAPYKWSKNLQSTV